MFLSILILNVDKFKNPMKSLKIIFNFYVFSNLHVSVSVACLVLSTGVLFEIDVVKEALFLGCSTFVAYHLIRYLNRYKYGKTHLLDIFSNQYKNTLLFVSLLTSIGVFFLSFRLQLIQLLRITPFGLLTFFYAFSFVNIDGNKYSIRYIPGLKIFIIAIVWAGVVVFFVNDVTKQSILYFLEMLLFVIALTIPFDLRDLSFDKETVKTLPMVFGVQKVKFFGVLLMVISVVLHQYNFDGVGLLAYVLTACILSLSLFFTSSNQSKYYASFWIEGIPILYYLWMLYL